MKKVSLFTLAFITGLTLMAQDQPKLRTEMELATRFGLRGGVNLATLEIDDDNTANMNTNMKTSFHGGVFVNLPLTEMFRFQPELSYTAQGTKSGAMTSSDPNLAGINEYDIHYLSLPLMFQYQTPGGFFVELGPQFSYMIKANGDRQTGGQVDLKDREYIKKADFAAGAGIGYLSRIGLGLNGRYNHGFSNVFNGDQAPQAQKDTKFRNRVVQLGLVYHMGANK